MVHSRIRVGHPQSNGKLEGFPKTRERLPSPFNSLAPFDYLKGKDPIKHRLEVRKTSLELARRIIAKNKNKPCPEAWSV